MKLLFICFLGFIITGNNWLFDVSEAKTNAKQNHQLILLNFSGSDWCGPCIRTESEIFENEAFENYAKQNLILLKADFPRLKKNRLSASQLSKNNNLAMQYNPEGVFPLTLLLDKEGNVLKSWKGYPNVSANDFVAQIKSINSDL